MSFNPIYRASPQTLEEGNRTTGTVDNTGALRVALSGSGSSSSTVQGPAADDAAVVGNPVLVAGKYESTLNTVENGDVSTLKTDANGRLLNATTRFRFILATASAMTRPANTTAYTANDAVSNDGTAASVTAISLTMSNVNDDPVTIERIRIASTDTGAAGKAFRIWLYRSDPTASSGIVGGDNAAFSTKQGTFIGSCSGTFRTFSDGSVAVCVPDEGSRLITVPTSGAATVYALLQTLEAFTPSANSTTFTLTAEGFQGVAS